MSGKRPTDHLEPSAKKRGSDRQLTKDDESDDEGQVVGPGNFARASEEVIMQRKIIKARRTTEPGSGAGKPNPFAGIQLAATTAPPPAASGTVEKSSAGGLLFGAAGTPAPTPEAPRKPEEANTTEPPAKPAATAGEAVPAQECAVPGSSKQPTDKKGEEKGAEAGSQQPAAAAGDAGSKPVAPSGGFGALGSGSGGLAFGSSSFGSACGGFGSLAGASSGAAFSFGAASAATTTSSIFSFTTAAAPSFNFAAASTGATNVDAAPAAGTAAAVGGGSLFGATPIPATGTPIFGAVPAAAAKVELPGEQAVTTGEEDERTLFSGEGALFEFDSAKQWRERGRGEMRVNLAPSGQARLVMRQKGNLRLLMNANLWGEMQLSKMEGGKGVTFACVNHAITGEEGAVGKKEGEETPPADAEAAHAATGTATAAPKLTTFALRIKQLEVLEEFVAAVNAHKAGGKKQGEPAPDP